jgi:hypothetical protein
MFCFVLVLLTVFLSGSYAYLWKNLRKTVNKDTFFRPTNTLGFETGTIEELGGLVMGDFINSQIPPKSIFLVPGSTIYTFPMIFDQYMTAYARTLSLANYQLVYEKSVSFEDKLQSAANSKAEYILLYAPEKQGNDFFTSYPQYFQPVFQGEGKAIIYKVNRVDLAKEIKNETN